MPAASQYARMSCINLFVQSSFGGEVVYKLEVTDYDGFVS